MSSQSCKNGCRVTFRKVFANDRDYTIIKEERQETEIKVCYCLEFFYKILREARFMIIEYLQSEKIIVLR